MALTWSDLTAVTNADIVPNMVDNVFKSSALLTRLRTKRRLKFPGGTFIRQPIMYQQLKGGPTTRGATFDVSYVETDTAMAFLLKEYYVNITMYGVDSPLNKGPNAAMSMIESKMANAASSMATYLDTDLFNDGQGTVSQPISLDGLLAAVDNGTNYASYGGITRSDIAPTDANNVGINAYYNSLTGPLSLSNVQTAFGATWFGNEHVDLMVCPQSVWDILWSKIQPQQRFNDETDIAEAGFHAIRWNGCTICVDQYAPAGILWGLNTDYVDLYVSDDEKWAWGFTGFKEFPNSVDAAGQYLFLGNLVVSAPRLCFQLAGITS